MESKGLTERTRGWEGPRMQVTPPANCCMANGFRLDFKPGLFPCPLRCGLCSGWADSASGPRGVHQVCLFSLLLIQL